MFYTYFLGAYAMPLYVYVIEYGHVILLSDNFNICRFWGSAYIVYCFCLLHFIETLLLFSHSIMSNSFATIWTVAYQAPLSMGFFRQEYRSGLPFPSPGNLPNSPVSPSLQADSLPAESSGKPTSPPYPPKRGEWPLVWTGQNKKKVIQAAGECKERRWELSVIDSAPSQRKLESRRHGWRAFKRIFLTKD